MDKQALIFESIYRQNSNNLFLFCLSRVSNREQAMDITQETFLRLWREIKENKKILNEQGLLFTIARNLIIDWYRKKKNIQLDKDILEKIESGEMVLFGTTNKTFEVETEYRYVLNKINTVPDSYKYPLYLRLVKDFSIKKIAAILGISVNAATVRISRGLKELRKIITRNKN